MIREARPTDIPDLMPLAIEALESDSYPQLKIDRSRVFLQASSCVNSKSNFAWVSEHEGKLVGALCALTAPHAFYEGKQALVLMWYCKQSGDGMKLMRAFLDWLRDRTSVNCIEYSLPQKQRNRMIRVLKRFGFTTHVPALCILR